MARKKELTAVLILAVAALIFISLATYRQSDIEGEAFGTNVSPDRIHNACGRVGAWSAYGLFFTFGYPAYVLVALLAIWGGVLLLKHEVSNWKLKIVASLAFVVFLSGFLSMHVKMDLPIPTFGGLVGAGFDSIFRTNLGVAGATLVSVIGIAVSGLFATEWFFWTLISEFTAARREAAGDEEEEEKPAPKRKKRAAKAVPADDKEGVDEEIAGEEDEIDVESTSERIERKLKKLEDKERARKQKDAERRRAERADAERSKREHAKNKQKKMEEGYHLPSISLLADYEAIDLSREKDSIRTNSELIEKTLADFDINARVVEIDRGPVITLYEIDPAAGIKVNRIIGLENDLARALKAPTIRIIAPIPGKSTVGIEVPNSDVEIVRLKDVMESESERAAKMGLPLFLGKDASGAPVVTDLTEMPHLLVAGTTGSGKSVCLNACILSILLTRKPDEVKFVMIDPKMVELSAFREIPHLMHPVVTDMKKATSVLEWMCLKMDQRYNLLSAARVKNIKGFNRSGPEKIRQAYIDANGGEEPEMIPRNMPYLVVVVDELAELMMVSAKEVESAIIRLAQKARAVGIHVIVATQRPSADVITGLIKSNLPSRIGFRVASAIDSRTILDQKGAEKLLGKGDMLWLPPGRAETIRAQCAYVDDQEIRNIVAHTKTEAEPIYEEPDEQKTTGGGNPIEEDELYDEAVRYILESGRGSSSLLQRRLGVGYSRASRLIEMMGEHGIVGPYKGSQAREVYYTLEDWETEQAAR